MPLSEKELAVFLWEQPRACEARGLNIGQAIYCHGRRYRHLSLGPYGIAQQVSVCFVPAANRYFVQVVLNTSGAVGAHLYLRAKQQLSALAGLLERAARGAGLGAPQLDCVLIGRRVELAGNFIYAFNLDSNCHAFTYRYDAAGVHFQQVSKGWGMPSAEQSPELQLLSADLLSERADALAISKTACADWLPCATTKSADPSGLVVTANGVIQTLRF